MRSRAIYLLITLCCLLLLGGLAFPQQVINGGRTILGLFDASGATHTLPFKVVANTGALPATGCTPGEQAIVTAATLGQQIYRTAARAPACGRSN